MSVPDIRTGDLVRVFGKAGAQHDQGEVINSVIVEVTSTGVWASRPGWLAVYGYLCRQDLRVRAGSPRTQLNVTGPPRSTQHPDGMWELIWRAAPR